MNTGRWVTFERVQAGAVSEGRLAERSIGDANRAMKSTAHLTGESTMKITSRLPSDPVMEAKVELAAEVALELDDLVDKLDEWLEVRIREEFDELRLDLIERLCTTVAVNDALIEENVRLAATCAQLQGLLERQVALNG